MSDLLGKQESIIGQIYEQNMSNTFKEIIRFNAQETNNEKLLDILKCNDAYFTLINRKITVEVKKKTAMQKKIRQIDSA